MFKASPDTSSLVSVDVYLVIQPVFLSIHFLNLAACSLVSARLFLKIIPTSLSYLF